MRGQPRQWRVRCFGGLWCLASVLAMPPAGRAEVAAGRQRVAVVDVSRLILENRRFRAALDLLEAEGKRLEGELKKQQLEIAAQAESLRSRQASTALTRAETALAKRRVLWRAQTEAQQVALLQQQDELYARAYREAHDRIAEYCRRHRIALVLQQSSKQLTPSEGRKVLDRLVIHQDRVNITPAVLRRINASQTPRYGPPKFSLEKLPRPARFLFTLPAVAAKRVAEVRAAATLDRLVFPPAS